jgi:hypothetical protein
MKLEGFDTIIWDDDIWQITGTLQLSLRGKMQNLSLFNFRFLLNWVLISLKGDWQIVAKSLFILRFHRKIKLRQINVTSLRQ